jgi:Fur family transcriptional regulator, zinc uptake regulator
MANHAHTLHHKRPLNEAAQAALEASGEQWTPMRANVWSALIGFVKPASAYDIAESLSQSLGRRIAANSIYRILDLFVAANVARRVESANAFLPNVHPDCDHDCIFLICDACGTTTHLDDDAMMKTLHDAASATGFHAMRPVVEMRGKCANCR